MDGCCTYGSSCCGTGKFFSRWSRFYARRYRTGGLEPVQKLLLEGIRRRPVKNSTVLDIGCGVGSLHLTLLNDGAERAIGIDMSEGMLNEARRLAATSGTDDRVEYIVGDFVQVSSSIPETDTVMLDKVVCCYEDVTTLVTTAVKKTKHLLALSHPKENIMMMSIFKAHMLIARLFHWSFHPFWHNWNDVAALIESNGFQLVYNNSTLSWQVLVFKRI
jgi:2-polyprenyl-3-methyl-5-hydroxy-6-metoxy-1,4-benzoquinol methylase